MATLKDIILLKRANQETIITENLLPEDVLTGEVILCYEDGKERLYCKNTDGVIVPLHRIWNGEEIIVEEPKPTMEAVDLGLPSGNKWAKCNLGANSEEEAGLYYQWGDTQGYTKEQIGTDKVFDWSDYKFSIDGSSSNFNKYSSSDSKTQLDIEDDAAYAALGGNWRMPTQADFQELTANTTTEVTSIDRIQGMKFTSKENSNYLFFPFTGYARAGSIDYVDSYFGCWSSTLGGVGGHSACNLSGDRGGNMNLNYSYRRGGQSVRGVLSL